MKSLLAQSYKNIEIITVDDGSTDESGAIIDRYSRLDKRVKTVHKANGGLSSARNAGLDAASGDYVLFVDGDDWVEPECVEMLLSAAISSGADMSCCGLRAHGMTLENYNPEEAGKRAAEKTAAEKTAVYTNIEALEKVRFMACGKLYAGKLFAAERFPAGRVHEDEFLTYRLIYNSNKVACTARQLYNRNLRQGSITRSGVSFKSLDIIDALKQRAEFYGEKGLERLRVKTEKSLVGTIARLAVKNRSGAAADKEEIAEKLDALQKSAIAAFRENKKAALGQKLEVLAYEKFPAASVFAVELRNKLFTKNIKN